MYIFQAKKDLKVISDFPILKPGASHHATIFVLEFLMIKCFGGREMHHERA